jgi:hypothetical protein
VIREIWAVESVEPSSKFPGKWVAQIQFHPDAAPQKYWMSDKQKGGLDRCERAKQKFCAIDATDPAKERFIYASSNSKWLEDTFLPKQQADDIF